MEEIRVEELPEQRLAAVRHVGPFSEIGAAFDRLGAWVQANPDAVVGAPLAIYLDDPGQVPPDQLRSDAAVPITADVTVGGAPGFGVPGVSELTLAGGRYAAQTHAGPYTGLAEAWPRFMAAVAATALHPDWTRPCFEVYLDEPGTVPDADLRTRLYAPVA
jgi:AraC family transcriptional regulator